MNTLSTHAAVASLLENCLNFKAQVSLEEAADLLRGVCYNSIPENLSSLPADLKEVIGPIAFTDRSNPSNGSFENIKIWIGNEGSLVVYISSNLFYRKHDNVSRHKAVLEALGEKYKANEVDVSVEGAIVTARFWWD